MSSGGENSSLPPSPKKARMSPSPPSSSWLPSCDTDTNSQGEQESCASVDSGLSDSATPPHDSATPPVLPTNTQDMPEIDGEDGDDLSSLSGLSDMSGQEWKPDMSGKLAWLHRAMARGENPRGILDDMLPPGSEIPEGIDTMTLWKVRLAGFKRVFKKHKHNIGSFQPSVRAPKERQVEHREHPGRLRGADQELL